MRRSLLILLLLSTDLLCGQGVEPAPDDKAVMYFVRANSTGSLINFTYFDSAQVIGRFNGPK